MKLIHVSFSLPSAKISNPDVTRLINSDEIQSAVRPAGGKVQKRPWTQKKNALVNRGILFRLNPYAKTQIRHQLRTLFVLSFVLFLPMISISVYQQRVKKQTIKRPKAPKAAGKEFLNNLLAP